VGHTQEAKKELLAHVDFQHTENVLNTVKPTRLLQRVLRTGTDAGGGDVVLDFFAGSAAMAEAVLKQNREDGGNRRFIVVQFAEPLPMPEPGLATIADIAKTRLGGAIAAMQPESGEGQLALDLQPDEDLGFKVFKLAPSTFRRWDPPESEDAAALEAQLSLFDEGLSEDADPRHVIYEVLLKEGYSLNAAIEPLDVETNQVYRVTGEDGAQPFYICLDEAIAPATPQALGLDRETTFVCLDTALDDSQKVNLAMQCQLKAI